MASATPAVPEPATPAEPGPPRGTLVLVPNTLDLGAEAVDIREVLPEGVLREAARLAHWVAEDARTTRAFLKRVHAVHPLVLPLQSIEIQELPRPAKGRTGHPGSQRHERTPSPESRSSPGFAEHARHAQPDPFNPWHALLAPAFAGHDIGLISEAGLPAVADPGSALVAAAHALHLNVRTLPGPSSLLLALAASGLNGQSFAFVGYLPQDAAERVQRIRELEALSRKLRQTQLFIETPYRNEALLQALLATLAPTTRLAVSSGLTLPQAFTRSDLVSAWRTQPAALPAKTPAVFAIQG